MVRTHGGLDGAELFALNVDPARVLDVSVNTNPYGPCAVVRDAIEAAAYERYPDPTALRARTALATMCGVSPDEVALGNGAAELLWTLARALSRDGGPAVIVEPTFAEARAAFEAADTAIVAHGATRANGFAIDLGAVAATVRAHSATIVYLCTPNTPTGVIVPAGVVAEWAAAIAPARVLLDQSFLSLSERAGDARVPMPPNVIRVRSLTKDHGIPGVRCGYAIASRDVIASVEAQRPAWTTGAHAQAAALAATTDAARAFVAESAHRSLGDRIALQAALTELGLAPVPSSTVFTLVPVADAAMLRRRLLVRHQVLVRDCTSFGLPDHVRLAARPAPERTRLVAALSEELT
ncbi:MAG TPA: histidinol-phosphate transaminase [Kofleriaceae bacterium]|nr:histidinol-phosphate transaminase [Kofleriaceae bacterium]